MSKVYITFDLRIIWVIFSESYRQKVNWNINCEEMMAMAVNGWECHRVSYLCHRLFNNCILLYWFERYIHIVYTTSSIWNEMTFFKANHLPNLWAKYNLWRAFGFEAKPLINMLPTALRIQLEINVLNMSFAAKPQLIPQNKPQLRPQFITRIHNYFV